jgi:ASC-1-like (ASCH) protein
MTNVIRTLLRPRKYIELLRSGQRSVDACPATAAFHPLQRGDRLNIVNATTHDLELLVEIVNKQHYKSVNELIEAVGIHQCLGAIATTRGNRDRGGARVKVINSRGHKIESHEIDQCGVFALHLSVAEDM